MAATLDGIRTKVRRLTRAPSEAQLSTTTLDDYINTFVLYDFPEHLRLFALRRTLTFYTDPNVDVYETETVDTTDPLYDFKNRYITVHPPLYIAGYPSFLTESRTEFFGLYPFTNSIQQTNNTGDGATTAFSGTLSAVPIAQNYVTFVSIDANNNGLRLSDDGDGNLTGDGTGTINYITGAYTLNFSTAPGANEDINSETYVYVAARPRAVLYFDNKFTVRPIPDQVYPIQLEVYIRPTAFMDNASQEPELQQWWQYIAYGAAKKIFEDRMDLDSVALIMPEFKKQEELVLARTVVQQTQERSATIYTQQTGTGGTWFWWGNSNF